MSHHLLTLNPTDVLFFKDGRPMEGSSSGNGAAWPMPNVLSAAIHHALHRGQTDETRAHLHKHTPKRSGKVFSTDRENHGRELGSLQSAGPFPIDASGHWLFPRPADAGCRSSCNATLMPLAGASRGSASSLDPKLHPVVNTRPPTKLKAKPWLSEEAYSAYLNAAPASGKGHAVEDRDLFVAEYQIGIGIDPDTQAQDGKQFYSASYLRLKDKVRLGLICRCMDKGNDEHGAGTDLIREVFPNSGTETHILAGGQQRSCTVRRESAAELPLPRGPEIHGTLVKWVLLTPAIFPELKESEKNPTPHPGGWLPSWIHPQTFEIQLKDPELSGRGSEGRAAWRKRVASLPPIQASLIAALVPRSIPVTGWALHSTDESTGSFGQPGGARATHLAVAAGAVYYFRAASVEEARKLAAALNWHGTTAGTEIQNRRSTLMGEKGFGLGVCSNFTCHPADISGCP